MNTQQALLNPNISPGNHVTLDQVDRVVFKHCSFVNNTPLSVYNWFQRGTGIWANKASFMVYGNNDTWSGSPLDNTHTCFYQLHTGIRSLGGFSPYAFYICREMEFQHCLYGIMNYQTNRPQIILNNFGLPEASGFDFLPEDLVNVNDPTGQLVERGIFLTGSTGYTVEQNTFKGFNNPFVPDDYPGALGIWVDQSGSVDYNSIRNNDFQEMKMGIYVTRNNGLTPKQSGLQLFCNDFYSGVTDIYRFSKSTLRYDQGGNQGTYLNGELLAGNRFSEDVPDCSAVGDFVIDPDNTVYNDYFCHNQANTIPDCGGVSSISGNQLLSSWVIGPDPYDPVDCPMNYASGGGGGTGPGNVPGIVAAIGTIRAQLLASKQVYEAMVDANQKQSTIETIELALPSESQFVRDILLQRHPLSDEVLGKMIYYADKFNPWHLTQVFLANSPLSNEVLYSIENSDILSDFFMDFLYSADHGTSLRRLIELEMIHFDSELDKLHNDLAHSLVQYPAEPGTEEDVLMDLLPFQNSIEEDMSDKYLLDKVGFLLHANEFEEALNRIPEEGDWSSYRQLISHDVALAGNWEQADETMLNDLMNLAHDTEDVYCHYGRSKLLELGVVTEDPIPVFPIQYRSLQIEHVRTSNRAVLLGVWPNPTSSVCWIHYPKEADGIGVIRVLSPAGQLIHEQLLNDNGLVELDLTEYPSGIYMAQLTVEGKILENVRITVLK